jgi:hypothetical protein
MRCTKTPTMSVVLRLTKLCKSLQIDLLSFPLPKQTTCMYVCIKFSPYNRNT